MNPFVRLQVYFKQFYITFFSQDGKIRKIRDIRRTKTREINYPESEPNRVKLGQPAKKSLISIKPGKGWMSNKNILNDGGR